MGSLGGAFLFLLVVLGLIVVGGQQVVKQTKHMFTRGYRRTSNAERLVVLLDQLRQEGFFSESPQPRRIENYVLSSMLSTCSAEPGFFWDVAEHNCRLLECHQPERGYDVMLVWGNNSIAFKWQGRL